jgi:hypothetical protein
MRRFFANLLVLAVLIGSGYILLTYFPPSSDIFNKSPFPPPENSANKTKEDAKEESLKKDQAKNTELYKVKAADGKGIITPGTSKEIITSTFWSEEYINEEAPVLTEADIARFNKHIIDKIPVVFNLSDYKDKLSKEELTSYIKHYKIPDKTMYDYSGKAFQQSFYDSLTANSNLSSIKDINPVRYGVTVKKTSLRSFPTDSGAYTSAVNRAFDKFQETGCEPCEPILILHESRDKKWYFAQIYNYRGWIKSDTVALSDKEAVFEYTTPRNFLMVTGKSVSVSPENSNAEIPKEFKMGTKLYLTDSEATKASGSYRIKLPIRKDNGTLDFTFASVAADSDIHLGYLPYTRYNIVTQAFKLQGIPYDWGDKYSGRDCSSFIMYVYKTFGLKLPRNTDEQEICSDNVIRFKSQDNTKTRLEALDGLKPGAALYMPGHVMLYLGMSGGQHYIIQAFLGYSTKYGNSIKLIPTDQIAVTTVQLANSEGVPFIQKLTSAVLFEF